MNDLFIEKPYLEWHHETPFAIARLNVKYAHLLSKLALKYESEILTLNADEFWESKNKNSTNSRYHNYNSFLLDSAYLNLFLSLRKLFRFFLEETNYKPFPSYVRSWYNITREGQCIIRHTHTAKFIGSFLAFTEGENSFTSYGNSPDSNKDDYRFENKDGLLLITRSEGKNFHEVPIWTNPEHPRISYAFDIIPQFNYKTNKGYIPFDG